MVSVIGRNSFLGRNLIKELGFVYTYPRKDVDTLYWFASPSSQFLFSHAPEYCREITVDGFLNILDFCTDNDIKLIYPSSITVYNLNNEYSRCKAELEEIQKSYKNVLGLRIAATYGYEESKGEYASIIYQFCKRMKNGKRPVIFGDGEQTRDFIYIKDVVENMIKLSNKTGVVDIGSGINTSFNQIVEIINEELGIDIEPIYIDAPGDYIKDTPCKKPVSVKYSVREGIREVLKQI